MRYHARAVRLTPVGALRVSWVHCVYKRDADVGKLAAGETEDEPSHQRRTGSPATRAIKYVCADQRGSKMERVARLDGRGAAELGELDVPVHAGAHGSRSAVRADRRRTAEEDGAGRGAEGAMDK